MIIESRKMIFFHIPKTGGNSVTSALIHYSDDQKLKKRKQDGVERFELRSALSRRITKHSDLGDYYKALGPNIFTYYKFAILRNPFDRVESFYFSPHRNVDAFHEKMFYSVLAKMRTFSNFVSGGAFDRIETCLNAGSIQEIVPFERMATDLPNLLNRFDLNATLPHINKSRPRQQRLPWSEEMKGAVRYKFHDEIKFGNYQFRES